MAEVSPREHFVTVQSVVADGRGSLWVVDPAAPNTEKTIKNGPKLVQIDLKILICRPFSLARAAAARWAAKASWPWTTTVLLIITAPPSFPSTNPIKEAALLRVQRHSAHTFISSASEQGSSQSPASRAAPARRPTAGCRRASCYNLPDAQSQTRRQMVGVALDGVG